jgi:hypothetical protein
MLRPCRRPVAPACKLGRFADVFKVRGKGILDHDRFEEDEGNPLLEVTVLFCYVLMGLTVVGVGVYELAQLVVGATG